MAACLVVDDSDSMREVASEILTSLGHRVDEARSAADAAEHLTASGCVVDVVLLDWDLPQMGALDVLRAAATATRRPQIVLCATENDPRQFSLAKAAGAGFHVLKPYDRTTIARVMGDAGFGERAVA